MHVVVAVAHDRRADVGRVGRGDVGLGHREARADAAVEQGSEPAFLLRRRAIAREHFHVAGVGRGAVEHLRPEARRAAHHLAQRRVFEIGEAGAAFALAAGTGSTTLRRAP